MQKINTKEMILANLTPIGKQLAREADPTFHRIQIAERCSFARKRLNAVREAYREIKNDVSPMIPTLRRLMKEVGGTERNYVELIILAALGRLEPACWKVNPETLLIEFQK